MIKIWKVKFSAERRSDGSEHHREFILKAVSQIEAEDYGLRKGRLIGYRNYKVEAEEIGE